MGEDHEYSASLRVSSETLRLAHLVERLGEPTRSHDIGDVVSSRRPDSGLRRTSHWILEAPGNRSAPMDELIASLLHFAESSEERLHTLRADCDMDIFCGIFSGDDAQGGFAFAPELMARAATLDLWIVFDLY